ncbi:MAG: hypothetical protein SAMD01599839_19680 [Rectinema sp.]
MNKRQMQATRTQKLIFEAAVSLFKERGYNNVSIEDIAQFAGTAKGSFYTYFRTKSDIIIEEFRTIDSFYRNYAKNLKRYQTTDEKLLAFTRAQMRYVRDKVGIEMLKILYANNIIESETEKILIDTSRYLHELVRSIIEEGQANGELRTDVLSDRLALLFNRSFRSVFLDWAISNNGFDLVKEGVEFCKIIVLPSLCNPSLPQPKTRKRKTGDSL